MADIPVSSIPTELVVADVDPTADWLEVDDVSTNVTKKVHPGSMTLATLRDMALVAALDAGGFAIMNVGLVDGRDVSADGATLDAHIAATNPHSVDQQDAYDADPSITIAAGTPLAYTTAGANEDAVSVARTGGTETTDIRAEGVVAGDSALDDSVTLSQFGLAYAGTNNDFVISGPTPAAGIGARDIKITGMKGGAASGAPGTGGAQVDIDAGEGGDGDANFAPGGGNDLNLRAGDAATSTAGGVANGGHWSGRAGRGSLNVGETVQGGDPGNAYLGAQYNPSGYSVPADQGNVVLYTGALSPPTLLIGGSIALVAQDPAASQVYLLAAAAQADAVTIDASDAAGGIALQTQETTRASVTSAGLTIASGQLLLGDGVIGAPGAAFSSDPNTGLRWISSGRFRAVGDGSDVCEFIGGANPALRIGDGSKTVPSLSPLSDTNTGVFFVPNTSIGFSLNDTLIASIVAAGLTLASGKLLTLGASAAAIKDSAGRDVGAPTVATSAATSISVADTDHGKVVRCTAGTTVTVTVGTGLTPGTTVEYLQEGAGQVQIVGSSVTLRHGATWNPYTAEQWSSVVITVLDTDECLVRGDLEAA